MKHIKSVGFILAYLGIYYVFQFVDYIIVAVQAASKGISGNDQLANYINENTATILIPAIFISFLLYFLILKAREKNIFEICKIKKISTKNILLIISMTLGYSMALSAISVYVLQYFPSYSETQKTISGTMGSIIGIIAVIILAPIFEEILFRGIILSEIRENLKVVPAVIIQGVTFGVYHMNMFQGIYAAILGLILGYVCVKTMTILSSITAHITFNICGTFVFPILIYFTPKLSPVYIVLGVVIVCVSIFYFNSSTNSKSKLQVSSYKR